jgi:hypothetical protein
MANPQMMADFVGKQEGNRSTKTVVLYDAMVVAINKCHKIDEIKEIRDKSLALEQYARQAQNIEAEKKAIEIRLRAERKAGELLKEKQRGAGGDRKSNQKSQRKKFDSEYAQAKKDAKISDNQAHRWQKLAEIPLAKFEGRLSELAVPSTAGLIGGSKPALTDQATWLLGRLREFKRKGYFETTMSEVLKDMPDPFRKEAIQLIDQMRIWIGEKHGAKT